MKKTLSLLLLLVMLVSCKTVYVNKQSQKIASSPIELATIGITKFNLQINNFEVTAIPQLNQKIRVTKQVLPFNKTTFKAYSKASKLQGKKSSFKYVDSLPNKPKYVVLKITDNVTLLEELNEEHNGSVFNYLKTVPKANIITTISIVFDNNIINEISQAEELYLSNEKYKKYDLELYKNKKLYKTIELTSGTTFTYQLSSFCWGENNKHQPILVNIIGEHSSCHNNTQSSYQQVIKNKATFKF